MVIASCWSGRQRRRVPFLSPSAGWPLSLLQRSGAQLHLLDETTTRSDKITEPDGEFNTNTMAFDGRMWYFLHVVFKNWIRLSWVATSIVLGINICFLFKLAAQTQHVYFNDYLVNSIKQYMYLV